MNLNGPVIASSTLSTTSNLTCNGILTSGGIINANAGITTNNQNINIGSGTIQGGSIKSQVNSGTYTGVNSYFFTNGDVYGTTYFDNPQANSSINFRIGSSLPTYAVINTSGLSINGTITSNNNNINAGTGTINCGTLNCTSETDSGSITCSGFTSTKNSSGSVGNVIGGFYDNNTSAGSSIIQVGNNIALGTAQFGVSYTSTVPWGLIGGVGATNNYLTFDGNGYYFGAFQKPPNSSTYKLQVDGATYANGGLTSNGTVNIQNGSTLSNSVLQITPQSTFTSINCTNGTNSLTQPLVLNNNNGYGVCINTSTPQTGYQLTVNGSIYAGGGLTANGGLTMGANQNINLSSSVSAPSSTQLGYTNNGNMVPSYSGGNITSGTAGYFGSISLAPGTWMVLAKLVVNPLGSNAVISNVSVGFGPSYTTALTYTYGCSVSTTVPSASLTTLFQTSAIYTIGTTTTYYFFGTIVFSGASGGLSMGTVGGTNPYSTFTATRIA